MSDKTFIPKNWRSAKFDKPFLISIIVVTLIGLLIFLSASLGLQARSEVTTIKLIISQVIYGIIGGSLVAFIAYKIPLDFIKRHATAIYIIALMMTAAVFIPGIGFSYGGATRWLDLKIVSLQPAEVLKIATIILTAAWFSFIKKHVTELKLGIGGVVGIIITSCLILLLQPDTGTVIVIIASVGSMYLVAGAKWRHVFLLLVVGILALSLLIVSSDYRRKRFVTFLNPAADSLGAGYQTQQSMIAVGSGQLFGRGPGQSIQKFNYLPEPISDSIFAVFAEEYGFIGAIILLGIYGLIGYFGFNIANRLRPGFEKLLVVGLITMILIQSLLNIGAMVGVFPLSGMPLIFVSHGGTALMLSLLSAGLILNASTHIPKRHRNTYSKR